MNAQQRHAFHAIMGQLLAEGVHPDACLLFTPETFRSLSTSTILVHRETEAGAWMGPILAMTMNDPAWAPDRVLRTTIADVIRGVPQADPRSHVLAGYWLMSLLPIWTQERRYRMAGLAPQLADYLKGEAPPSFDGLGREILTAYDHALDQLELARELTSLSSDEGATPMRISVYRVTVHSDDGEPGVEYHTLKGKARQTCQGAATMGKEAELHACEVEAEPRDILVAGLEGDLEDYVEAQLLETYMPTHELTLAPGAWAWECVEEEGGEQDTDE